MRRLFAVATLLSLGILIAFAAAWIDSYFTGNWTSTSARGSGFNCEAYRGRIFVYNWNLTPWTGVSGEKVGMLRQGNMVGIVHQVSTTNPGQPGGLAYSTETWTLDPGAISTWPMQESFATLRLQSTGTSNVRIEFTSVSCWLGCLLAEILPAMWLAIQIRRRRRKTIGLCPVCGYDLRASPDRCPECGTPRAAAAIPD
jgi:hypothetical protein